MAELSQTEENYIKELYHLTSNGESVSTNALASSMKTTPASVNDMFKRLDQKGMLTHVKYKGAKITSQGEKIAIKIIRKHRLWEVFLVDKLNFQWDEVHEIAEQLEHVRSPLLIERMADFLDNPKFDPHGDPIPDSDGNFLQDDQMNIQELPVGNIGVLVAVTDDNSSLLQHLDNLGIRLGINIKLLSRSDFDQSIQAEVSGKVLFISRDVCNHLMISKP